MNHIKTKKLILNNRLKKELEYQIRDTDTFVFIYKEKGKQSIEIIDMSKYIDLHIDKNKAVNYYKHLLSSFNINLRPGESRRTFVKAYRLVEKLTLVKQ